MFKIDKNVPMPQKGHECNQKYPFNEMVTGDSFFASAGSLEDELKIRGAAYAWAKANDRKVTTSKEPGGIRVFMVK